MKTPFKTLVVAFLATITLQGCAYATTIDMVKIAKIESSYNPKAYNASSGAVGLCQITKPVLIEYNQRFNTKWNMSNLFNGDLNMLVATWYMNDRIPAMLRHYKIKDTVRNRLISYNAGIGNTIKGRVPRETRNYIIKYKKG